MPEWQEDSSGTWYTDKMPVCDVCGCKTECATQIKKSHEDNISATACMFDSKSCLHTAMMMLLSEDPGVDYLVMRGMRFKRIGNRTKKREPIGLSKRYQVMNRDGFQCVLCGASGKTARLEIDHVVPVSAGGHDKMDNLRTLCFDCNRGKGSKIEA